MSNLQPLWSYFSTLKAGSISELFLESFYLSRDIKFSDDPFESAESGFIISIYGGVFNFSSTFGDVFQNNWVNPPSAAPGTYQARLTNFSGNALQSYSSPQDSWINISLTQPAWYLKQDGVGSSYSYFTIELGQNGIAMVSANVTLESVVSNSGGGGIEP